MRRWTRQLKSNSTNASTCIHRPLNARAFERHLRLFRTYTPANPFKCIDGRYMWAGRDYSAVTFFIANHTQRPNIFISKRTTNVYSESDPRESSRWKFLGYRSSMKTEFKLCVWQKFQPRQLKYSASMQTRSSSLKEINGVNRIERDGFISRSDFYFGVEGDSNSLHRS